MSSEDSIVAIIVGIGIFVWYLKKVLKRTFKMSFTDLPFIDPRKADSFARSYNDQASAAWVFHCIVALAGLGIAIYGVFSYFKA